MGCCGKCKKLEQFYKDLSAKNGKVYVKFTDEDNQKKIVDQEDYKNLILMGMIGSETESTIL